MVNKYNKKTIYPLIIFIVLFVFILMYLQTYFTATSVKNNQKLPKKYEITDFKLGEEVKLDNISIKLTSIVPIESIVSNNLYLKLTYDIKNNSNKTLKPKSEYILNVVNSNDEILELDKNIALEEELDIRKTFYNSVILSPGESIEGIEHIVPIDTIEALELRIHSIKEQFIWYYRHKINLVDKR